MKYAEFVIIVRQKEPPTNSCRQKIPVSSQSAEFSGEFSHFFAACWFFNAGSHDSACLGQQITATGRLTVHLFLSWYDN
jgi:hypothetical protein